MTQTSVILSRQDLFHDIKSNMLSQKVKAIKFIHSVDAVFTKVYSNFSANKISATDVFHIFLCVSITITACLFSDVCWIIRLVNITLKRTRSTQAPPSQLLKNSLPLLSSFFFYYNDYVKRLDMYEFHVYRVFVL